MAYFTFVKHVHISCVVITFLLFVFRGFLLAFAPKVLNRRFFRIAPHSIDTILLISAIALAIETQQSPFTHHWLTAKVLALLLYISLGYMALKKAPNKQVRFACFFGAIMTFIYITGVAITRSPESYFALLS